ncbi:Helix-turn-helix domain-containing protein [Variovorax sp. YR266]|uniref:helix-turn-helix domain-containing protein n=1 Tax=Variovorax sp. YR266 TaxID=1884386 RepID=UPI000895786C|nr:helix-turn-helix transcriptional regulator [Variovorax sp. YR266]SDY36030.1 Helix-turn-helix domain-containing protein [Variovorax sp. YR266]
MRSNQDPALLRAFAAELKARRAELGFNQEELAFAAGLNRTFVAKLETATTSPSLTSLVSLCEGLTVEPAELMRSLMRRYKKELRSQ